MQILIVEDHPDLGRAVCDYLQAHDYSVELVGTIASGRVRMAEVPFALLILDWDLPDGSGVQFCHELRDSGILTPVLLMTGHTEVSDKELGFESGADDYITKPFSMKELGSRVKALIRRNTEYAPAQANLGDLEPGKRISGRYKLTKEIGSGGMAVVWSAEDVQVGRSVVIKVMHGHLLATEEVRKRFELETSVLARINHPNVVALYDAGVLNQKIPYLVLEHVKGESLRDILYYDGPLPLSMALRCIIQACNGLAETHSVGVIHRDIKPENLLLQERSERIDALKIVDFGIAKVLDSQEKLTGSDMVLGTLDYLSPEQVKGDPVDSRTDVYALGVTMFELLTGEMPLQANTQEAMLAKILISEPRPPSEVRDTLGPAVDAIVLKALKKRPEQRFQSVQELKNAVEILLS